MIEVFNLIRDVFAVIGFITTIILLVYFILYIPEPSDRVRRGRGPLG